MLRWFRRLRIRRLRKAKLIRLERFELAMAAGNMDMATEHRKELGWYVERIEALTGQTEYLRAT